MKIKITALITALILTSLAYPPAAAQPETNESLQQKIADQQQEIDKLKAETIDQRKQLVELKSEIFSLKYGSTTETGDQTSIAKQMQDLQAEIENLKSEIQRLTALCQKAGINPDSDPDNIQQMQIIKNNQPRPKKIIVGQLFPHLKFKNLNGTATDIEQLQGKVVLIDFWAVWCGPCTKEMPNVIATYNKYHEKGFEIIGISLDRDLNSLKTYLTQNQITWPQYYDGKGWDNMISTRFGIRAIPATVLIDKDGIVRYTNLRGEQLENAVNTLCQPSLD
ncbi:MAG: TlpA family protein disulfide reductase [Planctomycetota bacterium]